MSAFTIGRPNSGMACGSKTTRLPVEVSSWKNDWPNQRRVSFGSASWAEDDKVTRRHGDKVRRHKIARRFIMVGSSGLVTLSPRHRVIRQEPPHQVPPRVVREPGRGGAGLIVSGRPVRGNARPGG